MHRNQVCKTWFSLNKIESNGLEFSMYACGRNLGKKASLGPTLNMWRAVHQA